MASCIYTNTLNETVDLTRVSSKYKPISTLDVLKELETLGWQIPETISIANTRKSGASTGSKHLVRLTHYDYLNDSKGLGVAPQLIIRNSFNGTSSFQFMLGMYRFACANGLIVGETYQSYRVNHIGDTVLERVKQAQDAILCQFDKLLHHTAKMQAKVLTIEQRVEMGIDMISNVVPLRTLQKMDTSDLELAGINVTRCNRLEDKDLNVFNVYNRAQENIVKGLFKMPSVTRIGMTKQRAITGINRLVDVNKSLWDVAERWAA